MQRSNIKINANSMLKDTEDMLVAGEVPEHIRQMIIDNKRMSKRIQILETEIE
jgi:hypothetical protein